MHIPFKAPAEYQFSYDVKDDYSKNDFGHSEDRSGYNTKGQYQVSQVLSLRFSWCYIPETGT